MYNDKGKMGSVNSEKTEEKLGTCWLGLRGAKRRGKGAMIKFRPVELSCVRGARHQTRWSAKF